MTKCETCHKGFPEAYAIYPRASDRQLECVKCCMAREERARKRKTSIDDLMREKAMGIAARLPTHRR